MIKSARRGPTAGLVLCLLDTALLALAWRVATLLAGGDPPGISGLFFPAAALLFLYALGLYRREALIEIRRSLGRLPAAAAFGSLTAWGALSVLPSGLAARTYTYTLLHLCRASQRRAWPHAWCSS
ncbi:hypothetical protein ACLF3G_27800 [Falsiroseomonas sp. HC035]|uniref:hypothetical protein n=1 Tax=Falsiroseomonas sp. HC035 TaxID=3390999 RepID=UPI003D3244CB